MDIYDLSVLNSCQNYNIIIVNRESPVGERMNYKAIVITTLVVIGFCLTTSVTGIVLSEVDKGNHYYDITYILNGGTNSDKNPSSYRYNTEVTFSCATEGAVISYSTDGGETWTEGSTYTVNEDVTLLVKATLNGVDSPVITFAYTVITFDTISAAMEAGEKVQLVGFGVFDVKERGARIGRNPKTKEEIKIAASRVPTFKAGKALKDVIAK